MTDYVNIQNVPDRLGPLLLVLFLMTLFLAPLAGCAGKISRTEVLLKTEYLTLSDDDLLLHYYQLEDQIVADERDSTGSSVSLGLGTGLFGSRSHFGGGVGVSTEVGSPTIATELRDRRNLVRLELQKRGVVP